MANEVGPMHSFFEQTKILPFDGRTLRQNELSRPLVTDQRRADANMTTLVSSELLGSRVDVRI